MKIKPSPAATPAPLPPTLAEQKSAFTAEGAPPPGKVAAAPAASTAAVPRAPSKLRPKRSPR